MRALLVKRNLQLTKSLGQNFLHDGNQLRRIVAAAELQPADRVLEIGPGLGPLTELLLAGAGEVLAIEKDGRLVNFLREHFAAATNLTLRHDDALAWLKGGHAEVVGKVGRTRPFDGRPAGWETRETADLEVCGTKNPPTNSGGSGLEGGPNNWRGWKLVANLPYSVASPLLVELALARPGPDRMVATLQHEVAQRLMAGAGDEDYAVLTLLVQLDYEPGGWFKIPAGCFFPAPEVDSACVTLRRRAQPLLSEEQRPVFVKIVKRAFSQRRKMMLKLLKQDWPADALTVALAGLDISPMERAEKLSVEQFAGLTRLLVAATRPDAGL